MTSAFVLSKKFCFYVFFCLGRAEEKLLAYRDICHGGYIGWYLRNSCEREEQFLLVKLSKAFD